MCDRVSVDNPESCDKVSVERVCDVRQGQRCSATRSAWTAPPPVVGRDKIIVDDLGLLWTDVADDPASSATVGGRCRTPPVKCPPDAPLFRASRVSRVALASGPARGGLAGGGRGGAVRVRAASDRVAGRPVSPRPRVPVRPWRPRPRSPRRPRPPALPWPPSRAACGGVPAPPPRFWTDPATSSGTRPGAVPAGGRCFPPVRLSDPSQARPCGPRGACRCGGVPRPEPRPVLAPSGARPMGAGVPTRFSPRP